MKKLITLVLAILMVAALVVGCAKTEAPAVDEPAEEPAETPEEPADEPAEEPEAEGINKAEYAICINMGVINHPVHRQVQMGLINKAVELGYEKPQVVGPETGDQAEQFAMAETWAASITPGKAAMLMWNGDHNSDELVAKLWNDYQIIVGVPHFRIFVDDDPAKGLPEGYAFEMACDPVAYGQEVAKLAAKALDGKTGSFALTQNTKNSTENAGTAAFAEEFAKQGETYDLSGIKVLDVVLEGGEMESATTINLGIIQANPDLIGAFGLTGNSPVSWADAATKAGKADGELWIAGMDATDTNIQYLEAGKVQVIVAQPLVQEAAKTMEYFDILFNGGTVEPWTDLAAGIVTLDATGENSVETWKGFAEEVTKMFGA
jgi:ABC-type sugar transport system substrate-binding protein